MPSTARHSAVSNGLSHSSNRHKEVTLSRLGSRATQQQPSQEELHHSPQPAVNTTQALRFGPQQPKPWAHLPCAKLKRLEILSDGNCKNLLQLGPHDNLPGPGVLASCAAGLTSLVLRECELGNENPTESQLSQLSVLKSLQHLTVCGGHSMTVHFPGSVLAHLPHLTHLELPNVDVDDLSAVSCLTRLSVASIHGARGRGVSARLAPDIAGSSTFAMPASLSSFLFGGNMELDLTVLSGCSRLTQIQVGMGRLDGGEVSGGAAVLATRQHRRAEVAAHV